ncbi:FYVE zinc finger-domain-containing protein [Tuber borchii]|uniref:RING-type E3 ubiquitin transferase n=1 Tax=Tuber borchii TaxID=42251 RepID=A0A2T6ZHQ8_TUBBO|nr:FYVE zinc finger-domain-containing protein [Tuber borchii]
MESSQTQARAQPPLPPLPPLPPPAPTHHPRRPSNSLIQPPPPHLPRRNSNHGSVSSHSSQSPSPHRRVTSRRQTSELVLPEWQPDESVNRCPICHNGFTFFNRRHHCRKCGRVVCNPCSPHRITIPKAFVVRPTTQTPCYEPPPSRVPDSPGDADYEDNVGQVRITAEPAPRSFNWNSSSGDEDEGMQVRICEQCLGRRPSDSHPGRGVSGPIPGGGGGGGWVSGFLGGDSGGMGVPTPPPGNRDTNRRRRQSIQGGRSLPHIHHAAMSPGSRSAYMSYQAPPPTHHHYSSTSSSGSLPSRRGQQPYYPPVPFHPSQHPRSSSQNAPPRPRLKETDYCPICTHPLPPVDPNGSEDAREEHIQSCIRAVESSASPANTPAGTPNPPGTMRARRYTGGGRMVVWKASEKDTWASGGEADEKRSESEGDVEREKAECVICFEEFEVGDVIARLECLCRYHKKCIRMWFDKKGSGECPVHAVHE